MAGSQRVMISYAREDKTLAEDLCRALRRRHIKVWMDTEIRPAAIWLDEIEESLAKARAVVVLVSAAGRNSPWLSYECGFALGFARGAREGKPVIPVFLDGQVDASHFLHRFQGVRMPATAAAPTIARMLGAAAVEPRAPAASQRRRVRGPLLRARFQERDGELLEADEEEATGLPSWRFDVWLDNVPAATTSVAYEVLDVGFRDAQWNERRGAAAREFLTDDFNSYGDVSIVAASRHPRAAWRTESTLYRALVSVHGDRPRRPDIRKALRQIRDN